MADEQDPFAMPAPGSGPSFKAGFDVDTSAVDKLAAAMDNLAKKTDTAEKATGRLSKRSEEVRSRIAGILTGGGLSVGGSGGGRNNNGGGPTVSGGAGGRGNGGIAGGIANRELQGFGGPGGILAADFGLDLARYISNINVPGYSRMQRMLQGGLPLDAYATQWAGAYGGLSPRNIPSRLVNGGAIGTPGQVAGAAQYGASMGAIPGANQIGGAYWSSVNQLQRMAPGLGPEAASQISGGLLNPAVNNQILMRYGLGATPMTGGKLKPFNEVASGILKALRRVGAAPGSMPTKEQLMAGLLPGSRLRQQMRVGMGLDDETITMVINWGINNAAYASRGGQGIYNPSDENQRKLATGSGKSDTLSNYVQSYQQAQTGQTANFMQGQYGSMSNMVQVQTDLTNIMSHVDDAFTDLYKIIGPVGPVIGSLAGFIGSVGSAIIALKAFTSALGISAGGAGAGAAGGAAAGGYGGIATGAAATGLGAVAGGVGVLGVAYGVGAISKAVPAPKGGLIGKYLGNPPSPTSLAGSSLSDVITHPSRLYDPRNWFGDLPIGDPQVGGLSGDFKKKLSAMMSANPNIAVTSGYRSASTQSALRGIGNIGPAGDSWHVRGMAADLGPPSQFGWIAKNASKFGLDSGGRWGEPWHVQPRGTAGKRPTPNLFINQSARGAGAAYRGFRGPVGDIPGLSITDIMAQTLSVNAGSLFSSGGTSAAAGAVSTGGGTQVSTAGSGQIDKVLAFLYAQLGKPYSASKPDGPDSWDCSGLVTGAYKEIGINLPSLTFSQVKLGTAVAIDPKAIKPGDCIFMRGGSPPTDLGHVAVAINSSEMISAPHTGAVVHISSIPWNGIQAIRRYVNAGTQQAVGQGGAGGVSMSGSWQDFLQAHMETSGRLDPNATMSGPQVAAAFYRAGFRGNPLTDMVAISGRESGWNPTAFNFHAQSTGDVSLGLVQENVKGSMISRLKDGGLSDPRQLFNADNAARMAFILSQGGSNLSPWGGYKGLSNTYGTNMQSAVNAVAQAKEQGLIGDISVGGSGGYGATNAGGVPAPVSQMSYATTSVQGAGGGVAVTNNFYIQTSGGDQSQGMKIAQTAGRVMREQLQLARSM